VPLNVLALLRQHLYWFLKLPVHHVLGSSAIQSDHRLFHSASSTTAPASTAAGAFFFLGLHGRHHHDLCCRA
jgi:hypothetical protein